MCLGEKIAIDNKKLTRSVKQNVRVKRAAMSSLNPLKQGGYFFAEISVYL